VSFRACNITDKDKIEIALGLIAMRRAGKFRAVYVDAGRLSVSYGDAYHEQRHPLSWESAERRVEAFYRTRRRPSGVARFSTIRAIVA
jgi:hypothetical protein